MKNMIEYWARMVNEGKYVDEAGMSPADIIAMYNKEKEQTKDQRGDGATKNQTIKSIHVKSIDFVNDRYLPIMEVKYMDGRPDETIEDFEIFPGDKNFNQMRRELSKMRRSGGDDTKVDDFDVVAALLRRAFRDSRIEWTFGPDTRNIEEWKFAPKPGDPDWWYTPNEDFLGMTPDFVDSVYAAKAGMYSDGSDM